MQILDGLGLETGTESELIPATPSNKHGHYELKGLVEINNTLLAAVGSSWFLPLDKADLMLEFAEGVLGRQAEEFAKDLGVGTGWALKDPRFCLTLPFWRTVLDDTFTLVLPFRSPTAVANSLSARDGFERDLGLALWQQYHVSLLQESMGLKLFPVNFQKLIQNPLAVVSELAEDLFEEPTRKSRTPLVDLIRVRFIRTTPRTQPYGQNLPDSLDISDQPSASDSPKHPTSDRRGNGVPLQSGPKPRNSRANGESPS